MWKIVSNFVSFLENLNFMCKKGKIWQTEITTKRDEQFFDLKRFKINFYLNYVKV